MAKKKDKWIQKAVNPKHKGYCTPMTKKTCTPHRKALAKRFKSGKLQVGGQSFDFENPDLNVDPTQYDNAMAKQQQLENGVLTPGPRFMKRRGQTDPLKAFNSLASTATGLGNIIQNNKLKQQEKLQMLQSMTPRFMTNEEAEGLHNVPAYTKYGGEPTDGAPIGVVDSFTGPGLDEAMYEGNMHRDSRLYGNDMAYDGTFKNGGTVTSDKAKEILRDGTVHGHPLTARQKRYFGWIAGGKKQAGGPVVQPGSTPYQVDPDAYYGQNAILSYYKNKLNDQLKAKNPQQFSDYFKGLQEARKSGNAQAVEDYISKSNYNEYLSPDEVKKTLGTGYNAYLNSLKTVNRFNVQQGQRPLYGNVEGQNDIDKLNFGRRFASLNVTPEFAFHQQGSNKTYNRNYSYDPAQNAVLINESGDLDIRPSNFGTQSSYAVPSSEVVSGTKKMGGKYCMGGKYSMGGGSSYQQGGYAVGDEMELSATEIKKLKKMGYKIEEI